MSDPRSTPRWFAPSLLALGLAAAPLIWGACTEPPAATPTANVSIGDHGSAASGAPVGDDSTPPPAGDDSTPPPAAGGGHPSLDQATRTAIEKELAKLPPVKNTPLKYEECSAMGTPAYAALSIAERAALGCKVDSDCIMASMDLCMFGGCGTTVGKDHAAAYEAARQHIEQVACAPWKAGGCADSYSPPVPSCNSNPPVCKAGRCGR
jgi:hypothetical protein